jgi:hypothetical protein
VWRGQKNSPAVACRAGKFWERMPERQFLYDGRTVFVQMRNEQLRLQFLHIFTQDTDLCGLNTASLATKR